MNYSVYTEKHLDLIRKGELPPAQALAALDLNPLEDLLEKLGSEIAIDLNVDFSKDDALDDTKCS